MNKGNPKVLVDPKLTAVFRENKMSVFLRLRHTHLHALGALPQNHKKLLLPLIENRKNRKVLTAFYYYTLSKSQD